MSAALAIGLPVYNGGKLLEEALASILGQGFGDFTLHVVDNASTDSTPEIARAAAERDRRVRVHRNERNIGAPRNFNRAFDLAGGAPFFKWAAHDDLLEPHFLERCMERIQGDPGCALVFSRTRVVDLDDRVLRDYAVELPGASSPDPVQRFAEMLLTPHACYESFGIFRREVLARTPRIGAYLGSDRCLLAEVALHGRIEHVPEFLYRSREHGDRSVRVPVHDRARHWFGQGGGSAFVLPYFRFAGEHLAVLRRAPISSRQRLACARHLATWLGRNWRLLRGDLRVAARTAVGRLAPAGARGREGA